MTTTAFIRLLFGGGIGAMEGGKEFFEGWNCNDRVVVVVV
jgi:hypothetical protein